MKRILLLAMMMTIVVSASAMSYSQAKKEALFLSDKMAYELYLNDAQYEAVYEINLDYMLRVASQGDLFGIYWDRRNSDLRYVLTSYQFSRYVASSYFYRPLNWSRGKFVFTVREKYRSNIYYKSTPKVYKSYRGVQYSNGYSVYAGRNFAQGAAANNGHHFSQGSSASQKYGNGTQRGYGGAQYGNNKGQKTGKDGGQRGHFGNQKK